MPPNAYPFEGFFFVMRQWLRGERMAEISNLEFLKTVWGDREGVAELTLIGPGGIQSFPYAYPGELEKLVEHAERENGKTNVYFGVCLRKAKWPKGKRGSEKDALSSWCVWVDIDFKVIPREKALKLVKEFVHKPSIIVKSGGGVHCYWLLREPATGDELAAVKRVNKKIRFALNGDKQSVDLARVLRVPGSLNVKYEPPQPCTVSWWKPELRYTLDDFEFLPDEEEKPEEPSRDTELRETPIFDLPGDVVTEITKLLGKIWIEGYRHRMALYVSGVLAHAGISKACAREVVETVSNAVGGETAKRLKDVEDTYRNFSQQNKVGGAGLLDKMIKEEFPTVLNETAQKIYRKVLVAVRRVAPKGRRTNFRITKITKFDSRPAKYRAYIRLNDGDLINVDVETADLFKFASFRVAAYEQANRVLSTRQERWEDMLGAAEQEISPAPEEASPAGALGVALEEFIAEKKENPDVGVLRLSPGVDDDEIFFRTEALNAYLKERGIKREAADVFHFLRSHKWESGTRRFGTRVVRVWKKTFSGNGQADLQKPLFPEE